MQMAKVDLDALKRDAMSISAAHATPKRPSEELRSLSRQRKETAEQIVGQTLAQAGIDVAALREKLLKNDLTFRDAAKGAQKPQSQTLAKRRAAFQNNVTRRRAALEPLGIVPTTVRTSMVYLPEPFFISVSPTSSYTFSNLATNYAPYDSRANIGFVTDSGASVNCDFWFYWVNDSAFQVVVTNASSQTVLNGSVMASISGSAAGIFGHYEAFKFFSGSRITVYQGNTVAVSAPIQDETFDLRTHVELGVQRTLNFEYETLTPSTSGWPIIVPPQNVILITVAPFISWDFLSGWGPFEGEDEGNTGNFFNADFNSDESDYFMQCSGVALEIQSPVVSEPAA
jgi:hypothetical protein